MAKYRVGIIACGGIARAHARAGMQTPRGRDRALADSNRERWTEFGERSASPAERRYRDYRRDVWSGAAGRSSASAPGTASTPR